MFLKDKVIYEGDTEVNHYQVVDMVYDGRPARVLFSGDRRAAQSGIAKDGKPDMLFDYNQRFVELVNGIKPRSLLLIGGGAYTLPMKLAAQHKQLVIDVVELDDGLDAIAHDYFDFSPTQKLTIIHDDGRNYLNKCSKEYDMIIIDAFFHAARPRSLTSFEAAKAIRTRLQAGGLVAVNLIAPYSGDGSEDLHRQFIDWQKIFNEVSLFPAGKFPKLMPQNLVLIGQLAPAKPLEKFLPHPALPPFES